MNDVLIGVFDSSNNPKTGLSLLFTTYKNQSGLDRPNPTIAEVGSGFYSFTPGFSSTDLAFVYIINTGFSPVVLYQYVQHEDFDITNLPASPAQVYFAVFNSDNTPATGQALTFTTYETVTGAAVTPPTIVEVGGGFYRFAPDFTSASAYAYAIPTALNPAVVYGFIRALDFAPAATFPTLSLTSASSTLSGPIDLGIDVDDLDDIPAIDSFVASLTNLAKRLLRRLNTPTNALSIIDPSPDAAGGLDLQQLVNGTMTDGEQATAAGQIRAELLEDEEVADAQVQFIFGDTTEVNIQVMAAQGPFQLTIGVESLTAQLLFQGSLAS